jgi:hypothetical protein
LPEHAGGDVDLLAVENFAQMFTVEPSPCGVDVVLCRIQPCSLLPAAGRHQGFSSPGSTRP